MCDDFLKLHFLCIDDVDNFAEKFANIVRHTGAFVCLHGDIGSGKTAFTKLVCKHLNVKQKVTSPSFVILNEYKSGMIPVYHFDLYRLEKEGVSTIANELSEYSEGKILTMVEWAEYSSKYDLPFDRLIINISYLTQSEREFIITAEGDKSLKILEQLVLL